jgi:putative Ca2+/H+ antiporter (TMEM165/GDT1 family)
VQFESPSSESQCLENLTQPIVTAPPQQKSIWATFATTFVTIFLAEIGDKTQISTFWMTAQSHDPWIVFIGSASALITTSLLGVILGGWMAKTLSPKTLEKSAGLLFLLISCTLFWDVIQR